MLLDDTLSVSSKAICIIKISWKDNQSLCPLYSKGHH